MLEKHNEGIREEGQNEGGTVRVKWSETLIPACGISHLSKEPTEYGNMHAIERLFALQLGPISSC